METVVEDLDIPLLPSGGDSDTVPRTEGSQFRNTVYQVEHGDSLLTRANIIGITHGTMTTDGALAALLVFEFRFISTQSKRRYTSCQITISFEGSGGDVSFCPEVYRISPDGVFGINPTTRAREVKLSGNTGFGLGSSANVGLAWESKQTEDVMDGVKLSGTRRQLGDSDKGDAAVWAMEENSRTKIGVPTFLRTVVLLRRKVNIPFHLSIKVDVHVNFSLANVATDLRALFGKKKVKKGRPVEIDADVDPAQLKVETLDPKEADLTKLDDLDLGQLADVTMTTMIS